MVRSPTPLAEKRVAAKLKPPDEQAKLSRALRGGLRVGYPRDNAAHALEQLRSRRRRAARDLLG